MKLNGTALAAVFPTRPLRVLYCRRAVCTGLVIAGGFKFNGLFGVYVFKANTGTHVLVMLGHGTMTS